MAKAKKTPPPPAPELVPAPKSALINEINTYIAEKKLQVKLEPVDFSPYRAPGCYGRGWSLLINGTVRLDWTAPYDDPAAVLADLVAFQRKAKPNPADFAAVFAIKPANTTEQKDCLWQCEVARRRAALLREHGLGWLIEVQEKRAKSVAVLPPAVKVAPVLVPETPKTRVNSVPTPSLF